MNKFTTYYFFDEYGNCFDEVDFLTEEDAETYAERVGAEYFCTD